MLIKEYLKKAQEQKISDYKYYFVVVLKSKTRKQEKIISHNYEWETRETPINKYLNCEIEKIEKFNIKCSDFSFNGTTHDYTEKGDKIYIKLSDFLKINKQWARLIEKENKQTRFRL